MQAVQRVFYQFLVSQLFFVLIFSPVETFLQWWETSHFFFFSMFFCFSTTASFNYIILFFLFYVLLKGSLLKIRAVYCRKLLILFKFIMNLEKVFTLMWKDCVQSSAEVIKDINLLVILKQIE